MRMYLLLALLTTNSFAVSVTQYVSKTNGTSTETIIIQNPQSAKLLKRSNYFDPKKDYRLGEFKIEGTENLKADMDKLNGVLKKIKTVDDALKKKNSSFNALSSKTPHQSLLILDDFRIAQGSTLYPELKSIFDRLQSLTWTQASGIKISEDLKHILTIQKGKEVSRIPLDVTYQCEKPTLPSVCSFRGLGILYIQ